MNSLWTGRVPAAPSSRISSISHARRSTSKLKSWMDLDDRLTQAKLARHIAALANHGGGYLVFGFEDAGTRCVERPADLGAFNRDRFASIVRRYLTPAFQCDVTLAVASDGASFPVVRVPSHGAVPVTAKTDG